MRAPRYLRIRCEAPMSEDWNTKYGTRRVRRDPPTLEEAIYAAVGITDDQQQQAEIAAALMGLPYEEVLAEVKKTGRAVARSATRIIAGEQAPSAPWWSNVASPGASATTNAPAPEAPSVFERSGYRFASRKRVKIKNWSPVLIRTGLHRFLA